MKKLLLSALLLPGCISIAFDQPQTSNNPLTTDSGYCSKFPLRLGIKLRSGRSTLYHGKTALYKHRFVSSISVLSFAEWRATRSWGIELFGGSLTQGMGTGKQRGVNVTQEIGQRAICIDHTIVGIAPHFYPYGNDIISWFIGPWVGHREKIEAPLLHGNKYVPEISTL